MKALGFWALGWTSMNIIKLESQGFECLLVPGEDAVYMPEKTRILWSKNNTFHEDLDDFTFGSCHFTGIFGASDFSKRLTLCSKWIHIVQIQLFVFLCTGMSENLCVWQVSFGEYWLSSNCSVLPNSLHVILKHMHHEHKPAANAWWT